MDRGDRGDEDKSTAKLMLILDVRTRWSSTHQMLRESSHILVWFICKFKSHLLLGRALDYRNAIDSYTSRNRDLHQYELSTEDWDAISMVTSWLKSFHSATTQMSTTKVPMLSTTHAIFRGLQDDIKNIIRNLPSTVSPSIKCGLVDAHKKLSDYYHKYDDSPFYTWAACKWFYHIYYINLWIIF